MQGNKEDLMKSIAVLAETVLMKRIQAFYEDVETTSKTKREQKEKCIEEFVSSCVERFGMPQEEIRGLVDGLIQRYKWIIEIEELDEEELE